MLITDLNRGNIKIPRVDIKEDVDRTCMVGGEWLHEERGGEGRLNRSGGGNKKIPQYACCHKCKQNAGACYTRMEIKIIA